MSDLDYIKKFSKITVKKICINNDIDPSNLWAGRVSKEKIKLVRKAIESAIGNIYKEEYDQQKNNTL